MVTQRIKKKNEWNTCWIKLIECWVQSEQAWIKLTEGETSWKRVQNGEPCEKGWFVMTFTSRLLWFGGVHKKPTRHRSMAMDIPWPPWIWTITAPAALSLVLLFWPLAGKNSPGSSELGKPVRFGVSCLRECKALTVQRMPQKIQQKWMMCRQGRLRHTDFRISYRVQHGRELPGAACPAVSNCKL